MDCTLIKSRPISFKLGPWMHNSLIRDWMKGIFSQANLRIPGFRIANKINMETLILMESGKQYRKTSMENNDLFYNLITDILKEDDVLLSINSGSGICETRVEKGTPFKIKDRWATIGDDRGHGTST